MTAPVLVTGGTGTLGRLVVARLQGDGHAVRVLSRRGRPGSHGVEFVTGDLDTGNGLPAAVEGVATVVHCAGSVMGDQDKARRLVQAAAHAGVTHLLNISVVGADRIPLDHRADRAMFGYYGAQAAAERILTESGLPFTSLRATQFHDLVLLVARQLARLPVIPVPTLRFQPVDADEVAARLVELALGPPAGRVPDMGGPLVYALADLVGSYLRATGRRRVVVPFPLPGKAARAFAAGANLAPGHAVGRRTWEEFLAERLAGLR